MFTVDVCERFLSIQGESTFAGVPCWFIRLAGCNLRCRYCDTRYANEPGLAISIDELVDECAEKRVPLVEITGGEPLMQDGFRFLASMLHERVGREKKVIVETNGSYDISVVPEGVAAVIDVKTPSSGHLGSFCMANLEKLRSYDEIKFVLSGVADYKWAKDFVDEHDLSVRCKAVLFSAVSGVLRPDILSEWIIGDGLNVRMQVQLHKVFGLR